MDQVKVTLLGVQSYSFEDEKTKRQVEGTNCFFIEQTSSNTDNKAGFVPVKATLPIMAFDQLRHLAFPCDVNAVIKTEFTGKGIKTKIIDFKPLELSKN